MYSDWPFLGRDALVQQATAAFVDGPGGLVLQGRLGTGKTRLAQAVAVALAEHGWHVERFVGSAVGTGIPFGVISPLAVSIAAKDLAHNLELLRQRLLERAGRSRLLLVVDDANLVDASSLALFLRMVGFGDASILVTRRTAGSGNADVIDALWKDGSAALLDVPPLDRETHDRLVIHALGPIEAAVRSERLWQLSQGNPLFLRELLDIVDDDGPGVVPSTRGDGLTDAEQWDRLAAIVGSKTRRLADDERDALEIVAMAEPIDVDLLHRLASADALTGLERQGMVTMHDLGDQQHVSTAHPVYGATLRATLPPLRRKAVCSSLSQALLERETQKSGYLMLAASLLLEAGEQPPTGLAEAAASEALDKGAPQLAERIASAVVDHDATVAALTILGTAKSVQHAADAARPLFERAFDEAHSADDRVRATVALARHQAWIEQDPAAATSLLEALLPTLEQASARAELGIELAAMAAVAGDAAETARVAGQALREADAEPRLALQALIWSTLARCMLGRSEGLDSDLTRGEDLALQLRDAVPIALDQMQINRAMWLQAVDLAAALRLTEVGYARAAQTGGLAGVWSATQLLVVRDMGDLRRALGIARRAVAELERFDPFNNLSMVCAVVSHVHSLRGAMEPAAEWFEHAGPPERLEPRSRVHADRAEVWLTEDPEVAGAHAIAGGERAEAGTMVLWAAPLYHDAVRLGLPQLAVAPLARLAVSIDAPVVAAMAAHAEAAAAGDVEALTSVAAEFEQLGSPILAAEALAQAARCATPDTPESARAMQRALRLAADCPGAATPPLTNLAPPLTPRETEVATTAAAGLASRDIAEHLVISTRTVDNHLAAVYRKLGLGGRSELPSVFGPLRGGQG